MFVDRPNVERLRELGIHRGSVVARSLSKDELTPQMRSLQRHLEPMSRLKHEVHRARASHVYNRGRLIQLEAAALREEDEYVEVEFEARSLGIVDPDALAAAKRYDVNRANYVGCTQQMIARLKYVPTSLPAAKGFDGCVREVFRNRYAPHEHYDPFGVAREALRKHRRHRPWHLEDSIWAPRRQSGNSKDFLETQLALKQLFLTDWELAIRHHVFAYYLAVTQLGQAEARTIGKEAAIDGPAAQALRDVMCRYTTVIYNSFDYYAMLGKEFLGVDNVEVSYMKMNQFMSLVAQCRLENSRCDTGQISNVWSVVDAPDEETMKIDKHNLPKSLNRHEYIQAIARIGVRMYLESDDRGNPSGNVAEAVERMFQENFLILLPPLALQSPNAFRRVFKYRPPPAQLTPQKVRRSP